MKVRWGITEMIVVSFLIISILKLWSWDLIHCVKIKWGITEVIVLSFLIVYILKLWSDDLIHSTIKLVEFEDNDNKNSERVKLYKIIFCTCEVRMRILGDNLKLSFWLIVHIDPKERLSIIIILDLRPQRESNHGPRNWFGCHAYTHVCWMIFNTNIAFTIVHYYELGKRSSHAIRRSPSEAAYWLLLPRRWRPQLARSGVGGRRAQTIGLPASHLGQGKRCRRWQHTVSRRSVLSILHFCPVQDC